MPPSVSRLSLLIPACYAGQFLELCRDLLRKSSLPYSGPVTLPPSEHWTVNVLEKADRCLQSKMRTTLAINRLITPPDCMRTDAKVLDETRLEWLFFLRGRTRLDCSPAAEVKQHQSTCLPNALVAVCRECEDRRKSPLLQNRSVILLSR